MISADLSPQTSGTAKFAVITRGVNASHVETVALLAKRTRNKNIKTVFNREFWLNDN